MKLFQQLLVAPAALGLLAPLAVNAADVNINDVSNYADLEEYELEVSTSHVSDVVPGDWAYSALQSLSESYGCVENGYSQNLRSGQSLTRYEAASLINSCLEGGIVSTDSEDFSRLVNEFGTEMAILKGRVDGLEQKVQDFSAGQFSSATKLSSSAVFTVAAIDTGGSTTDNKAAFTYAYASDLNTSFNGTDLLTIGFEAGNANGADYQLDSAVTVGNGVNLTSLYYSLPVGDNFQITAGPLLDQDDVISATTSIYSDAFRLSSLPWGTVGTGGAPGAAIAYTNDSGWNWSLSNVSTNGNQATSGIWTTEAVDIVTASIGYDQDNWGGGVIYTNNDVDSSFGGGLYYSPVDFPTISVSYDSLQDRDAANSSDFMIALEHPVGPGTLAGAYQNTDTTGVNTSNFEVYYNYPVSDGIAVQGGFFVEENATAGTDDTFGIAFESFFTF